MSPSRTRESSRRPASRLQAGGPRAGRAPAAIAVPRDGRDIVYPAAIPFVLVHLACFAALWTGVSLKALGLCVALYWLRIFAIGAGYHRYFSHRSFETSRAFQFALAALAQTSLQSSVLWWAAKHRHHHLHADSEKDVHSPLHAGFFYSHVGWIFDRGNRETDFVRVDDLARYPELRLLHRFEFVPALALAILSFVVAGWSGLVVGFLWSTVLVYHATFCINSLAHVRGRQAYVTGDTSRNNWLLALFTMGEGWHNNHHAYQASVRQGFRWWQVDPTFYLLWTLSRLGLVWNLKAPPAQVVRNEQRPGGRAINRAAQRLVETVNVEGIARALTTAGRGRSLALLQQQLANPAERLHFEMPGMPSLDALRASAEAMFAKSQWLDTVVERAYEFLLNAVHAQLTLSPEGRA